MFAVNAITEFKDPEIAESIPALNIMGKAARKLRKPLMIGVVTVESATEIVIRSDRSPWVI